MLKTIIDFRLNQIDSMNGKRFRVKIKCMVTIKIDIFLTTNGTVIDPT